MNERGRQLAPIETRFFEAFFRRLEAAGITHILLRNYEGFPARIGHDVDLFFPRREIERAANLFREELRKFGGEVAHAHERDYVLAVWFRAQQNEPRAIHLDFYHGAFTWHSLPYLEENEIISQSRPFDSFRVPRPAHEAFNLYLTSLLWGGFFKSRYENRIVSLLQSPEENSEFNRLLKREFGSAADPVFDPEKNEFIKPKDGKTCGSRLRKAFKQISWKRRPRLTLFRLSRYWLAELGTVLCPTGLVLSVLGPDGSGKSTVIKKVRERIDYFFGETVERHWRPSLLPDIGVLMGRRAAPTRPVTNPHGAAPHGRLASFLRLCYYWLDYWVGYPTRVWKPKAKNHLVIFDRYADDMWCDPRRYRLNLPRRLCQLACRFVPQPDLTFVLTADAEVIQNRKGEISPDVLQELLPAYAAAAKRRSGAYLVDCTPPADQVADQIASIVLKHLQNRSAKHPRFR